MTAFPHWPESERFRTIEDALAFLAKPEPHLCIPIFVVVDGKSFVNPDYEKAPYEQTVVPIGKAIIRR